MIAYHLKFNQSDKKYLDINSIVDEISLGQQSYNEFAPKIILHVVISNQDINLKLLKKCIKQNESISNFIFFSKKELFSFYLSIADKVAFFGITTIQQWRINKLKGNNTTLLKATEATRFNCLICMYICI